MRSLIFILILLLFQSCGVFNKSKSSTEKSAKYLSWHFEDEQNTKQDCTRTITRDRVEYNFTFDPNIAFDPIDFKYNKPIEIPVYKTSQLEGLESTFDNLDYQLALLLRRATSLSVKIEKESDIQKNVKESNHYKLDSGSHIDIKDTATHLERDTDTTLGANIPSWVWLILILVIVAIIGIWAKKSKLLP